MQKFQRRYPQVQLHVRTAGSQTIPTAITQGEADFGLSFALYRDAALRQAGVGRFQLGAVMAPGHRLATRKTLSVGSLVQERVLLATPDLAIRQLIEPYLERLPGEFRPIVELNSVELARQLALRGEGITFLTRIGIEHELAHRQLVFVPLDQGGPVMSHLGVYVRIGRTLPPAVDLLCQVLIEEILKRERNA